MKSLTLNQTLVGFVVVFFAFTTFAFARIACPDPRHIVLEQDQNVDIQDNNSWYMIMQHRRAHYPANFEFIAAYWQPLFAPLASLECVYRDKSQKTTLNIFSDEKLDKPRDAYWQLMASPYTLAFWKCVANDATQCSSG